MFQYCYDSKIGKIYIAEKNNKISNITFSHINAEFKETKLIKETYSQLEEYFERKRTVFDIPINPEGTEFQKKVWNAIFCVKYGETASYKEIARYIGNEKAARAIGSANNKNPILIVIPCHRIIGSNGSLTGYRCGLNIKRKLLDIENIICQ